MCRRSPILVATLMILLPQVAAAGGEGTVCGGIAGVACRDGLWCDPKIGMCNAADIRGVCVRASPMCTREYRPVCGCDGKTYGNDCERRAARVAKHADGECSAR